MNNKIKLDFLKRVLTDTVDLEIKNKFFSSGFPNEEIMLNALNKQINPQRYEGLDWPENAHTMIGIKRLDSLHYCLDYVRENNIDGDLIETGVWRGGACIFMKVYCNLYNLDKRVIVSDSFEGLPKPEIPQDVNDKHYTIDFLKVSLDEVKNNFNLYKVLDEKVVFLKGWFSDTLPNNSEIQKISLLRMDGDMYKSTMDVFNSCYNKIVTNGILIVDDYCLPNCVKAVSDFRNQNNITNEINIIDKCGIFWIKK